MGLLINAMPLYNYLKYCESSGLEKKILDCGAGGSFPPLALFHEFGYEVFGIEKSKEQIEAANQFALAKEMKLNIVYGDMLSLPYEAESFSFMYSYNTSVHMPKKSFIIAMNNFKRVLKKNGLLFVNFLSHKCSTYGMGEEIADNEFLDKNSDALFVHYSEREIKKMMEGFEVLYFEERIVHRKLGDEMVQSGFYDYILRKV